MAGVFKRWNWPWFSGDQSDQTDRLGFSSDRPGWWVFQAIRLAGVLSDFTGLGFREIRMAGVFESKQSEKTVEEAVKEQVEKTVDKPIEETVQ